MSSRTKRVSITQRRESAHSLPSLRLPLLDDSEPVRPVGRESENSNSANDDQQKVVEEGEALFKEFLVEEIENESSVDTETASLDLLEVGILRTFRNNNNPIFKSTGRSLRQMADEFARTRKRSEVRHQANQVQANINYQQFRDILSELFDGGVTAERIVVLFFFCSDVARNVLLSGINIFQQFLRWSLDFITENVCEWVRMHGGWRQVLQSQFKSVYKLCFVATLSAAVVFVTVKYLR